MEKIQVVAGIIKKEKKLFCVQRPDKGDVALKWEFPGGKIEKGETHVGALKRELKEELDIAVEVKDYFMTVKHQYKSVYITMFVYFCEIIEGSIVLKEHVDYKWLKVCELGNVDWADADKSITERLQKIFV